MISASSKKTNFPKQTRFSMTNAKLTKIRSIQEYLSLRRSRTNCLRKASKPREYSLINSFRSREANLPKWSSKIPKLSTGKNIKSSWMLLKPISVKTQMTKKKNWKLLTSQGSWPQREVAIQVHSRTYSTNRSSTRESLVQQHSWLLLVITVINRSISLRKEWPQTNAKTLFCRSKPKVFVTQISSTGMPMREIKMTASAVWEKRSTTRDLEATVLIRSLLKKSQSTLEDHQRSQLNNKQRWDSAKTCAIKMITVKPSNTTSTIQELPKAARHSHSAAIQVTEMSNQSASPKKWNKRSQRRQKPLKSLP